MRMWNDRANSSAIAQAGLVGESAEDGADVLEVLGARTAHGMVEVRRLEQDVDERAAFEVRAVKPLVEEVEDREEPLVGLAPRLRASASTQPCVQTTSRCLRKASTSSSFDGKCR